MYEEVDSTIPSRPARKIDFLVIGLELAKDLAGDISAVASSFERAFDIASAVVCQHANYLVGLAEAQGRMSRQLETILEGEE